jgi:hypothetical protein
MPNYYVDGAAGNDANAGTAPGAGNAWATLSKAASVAAAADTLHVKGSATYDITAGLVFNGGSSVPNNNPLSVVGYTTTPGDGGKPTIRATASITGAMIASSNANVRFFNLLLNGNGLAARGMDLGSRGGFAYRVEVTACTSRGITTSFAVAYQCRVYGMSSGAEGAFRSGGGVCYECVAHDTPCRGFSFSDINNGGDMIGCIAARCTGAAIDGFNLNSALDTTSVHQCTAYGNGRHGIICTAIYQALSLRNSVMVNNGGYGLALNYNNAALPSIDYNSYYGNTSGARSNSTAGGNDLTLAGNPFVSPDAAINSIEDAWANFTPNDAAGAAIRSSAGMPYLDRGAVQHEDSGGGGGTPAARRIFVPSRIGV